MEQSLKIKNMVKQVYVYIEIILNFRHIVLGCLQSVTCTLRAQTQSNYFRIRI